MPDISSEWVSFGVQLAASLAGMALIAALAQLLGLGGDVRIRNEAHARDLADAALFGFTPTDIALDRAGFGALLRDDSGRVMLLRRHGVHFVGRLINDVSGARLDQNFLTIRAGNAPADTVTLDLGDKAQQWAGSFRRLGTR